MAGGHLQYRINTFRWQVFNFHKKEYTFLWILTGPEGIARREGLCYTVRQRRKGRETTMKLEWMGEYRDIIGDFYRSANGYSQICKTELFGSPVMFSPYEVQIMEHILEYADQRKNMKWYANRLGLSQATYSKYVRKLVEKGLVEKYHTSGNKKDIILQVSPLGMREYAEYAKFAEERWFHQLFELLDGTTPEELETVKKVFAVFRNWHGEKREPLPDEAAELIRVEPGR